MTWCENHPGVDYVLGQAKNARLKRALGPSKQAAEQACYDTGQSSRVFQELIYRTRKSWSRGRRVVGKAEHLHKGANPRLVVTSLAIEDADAKHLYEKLYCVRSDNLGSSNDYADDCCSMPDTGISILLMVARAGVFY